MAIIKNPLTIVQQSGGGASLNIEYSQTAPTDTSKIWVKAEEPESLEIKSGGALSTSVNHTTLRQMPGGNRTSYGTAVKDKNTMYIIQNTSGNYDFSIYEYNVTTNELETIKANIVSGNQPSGMVYHSDTNSLYYSIDKQIFKFSLTDKTQTSFGASWSNNNYGYWFIIDNIIIKVKSDSGYIDIDILDLDTKVITNHRFSSVGSEPYFDAFYCYLRDNYIYLVSLYSRSGANYWGYKKFDLRTRTVGSIIQLIASEGTTFEPNCNGHCSMINNKGYVIGGRPGGTYQQRFGILEIDFEDNTVTNIGSYNLSAVNGLDSSSTVSNGNSIYLVNPRYYDGRYYSYNNGIDKLEIGWAIESGNAEIYLNGNSSRKAYLFNSTDAKQEVNSLQYYYGDASGKATFAPAYYHNGTDWVQFT